MIKHIWSLVCNESMINQDNNALTLNNIFEGFEIQVNKDKALADSVFDIPAKYEIITYLWKNDKKIEEKADLRASIVDPNGKNIADPVISSFVMPKDTTGHRHRIKSFGFKVTVAGTYWVKIGLRLNKEKGFKIVSEIPIQVAINVIK